MKRLPYRIAFAAIVGALAAACASAPDQTAEARRQTCSASFPNQTARIVDGKCEVSYQSIRSSGSEYGPQRGSAFSPPSFPAESPSQ